MVYNIVGHPGALESPESNSPSVSLLHKGSDTEDLLPSFSYLSKDWASHKVSCLMFITWRVGNSITPLSFLEFIAKTLNPRIPNF